MTPEIVDGEKICSICSKPIEKDLVSLEVARGFIKILAHHSCLVDPEAWKTKIEDTVKGVVRDLLRRLDVQRSGSSR